jgi:type IV pilus assembly protein PilC
LRVIANQEKSESFKSKIKEIGEKVEEGTLFSQALSIYPAVFSPFYIGIVRAGEVSGRLSESLEYLADHLERDYNFRSKVIGAMIYPIFVLVVFIGVIILMLAFIIPQLSGILKESDQELPWITKTVISLSDMVKNSWYVIPIAVVVLIVLFFRLFKTKEGKTFFDQNIIKAPVIGGFLKKIYITRFAENLSTLIASGLPIIQAIEISRDVLTNSVFKSAASDIAEGIKKGETISAVLFSNPDLFPAMFSQMVMVGEKTGSLDKSLLNIVDFYQKEVERSLDALIGLLEPLMIIGLAALVLILMGAVLLPIYQLGTI